LKSEGFIARGQCLINRLDDNLINEMNISSFKKSLKSWVKTNISIKPKQKFDAIGTRMKKSQPNGNDVSTVRGPNLITNYFNPMNQSHNN